MLPKKVPVDLHIVGLQQRPESLLVRRRGAAKLLLDVPGQQDVELFHAAAATPKQFPEFLRFNRRHVQAPGQSPRSAKICLISPIALAGFRSFGQASVQFMMVWHRYSRNGSSS